MLLRKEHGGSGISYRGVTYEWARDGDVTEVPDDFATVLLGIRDGDYTVAVPDKTPAKPPAEVTEPAPVTGAEITEPAPGAGVTEPAPKTAAGGRRGRPAVTGPPEE